MQVELAGAPGRLQVHAVHGQLSLLKEQREFCERRVTLRDQLRRNAHQSQ